MTTQPPLPPYSAVVQWCDEDGAFVALTPEFPFVTAKGATPHEAIDDLQKKLLFVVKVMTVGEEPLPPPRKLRRRSGQVRLRLPRRLHHDLTIAAEVDGVSLNGFIVALLERGLGRRDRMDSPPGP